MSEHSGKRSLGVIVKTYSIREEEFFRRLTLPVEDIAPEDRWRRWQGRGMRWFRSPNIVCLEHYRRLTVYPTNKPNRRLKREQRFIPNMFCGSSVGRRALEVLTMDDDPRRPPWRRVLVISARPTQKYRLLAGDSNHTGSGAWTIKPLTLTYQIVEIFRANFIAGDPFNPRQIRLGPGRVRPPIYVVIAFLGQVDHSPLLCSLYERLILCSKTRPPFGLLPVPPRCAKISVRR